MSQNKFQWKKLVNTPPQQILFDQQNNLFLKKIINHKITEFEVENLPANYIVSFVEVLQNYIYFFKYGKIENNFNDDDVDYEQIIKEKNNQIEELKQRIIEYQEIINQKDKLLNATNKKLFSLNNQLYDLQKEYAIKIKKFKNELEEKEDDFLEMNNKLFDTFNYLNQLIMISTDGKVGEINKKSSEPSTQLNTIRTRNQESKTGRGDIRNNLRKPYSDKNFGKYKNIKSSY